MTNVVVLLGRLARPPETRELPSGDRLVARAQVFARVEPAHLHLDTVSQLAT